MKTPEQIFDEIDNDPNFIGCHRRIIAIECMKRFGLQCWIDSSDYCAPYLTTFYYDDHKRTFDKWMQNLYLNQIAKQAQENGEYES